MGLREYAVKMTKKRITVEVNESGDTTFAGNITGVGAIRKISAGTLALSGANAQTNNILGGGRLSVASDANLGGGPRIVLTAHQSLPRREI